MVTAVSPRGRVGYPLTSEWAATLPLGASLKSPSEFVLFIF